MGESSAVSNGISGGGSTPISEAAWATTSSGGAGRSSVTLKMPPVSRSARCHSTSAMSSTWMRLNTWPGFISRFAVPLARLTKALRPGP